MIYVATYIAAMVAANLSIAHFGPWISPVNAFVFIGLDLTLRDKLHDKWGGSIPKMAALILVASAVSYAVNPAAGRIALASFLAFAISAAVDWIAYTKLRNRPYMERVNGSNIVGAVADSVLFPTLAFGVFMPWIVLGQLTAKVAGGFVWSLILKGVK